MRYTQYYKIREKNLSETNLKLFREMSLKLDTPDYSDLTDNFFKPDYVNAHLQNAKFLEEINTSSGVFEVYEWFTYLLFISKEKYLAARIEFEKNSEGIKMSSIEVARPFKGLMKTIFLEYLLPKYKIIESDNVQTVNAFMFYKKLAMASIIDKTFKMYLKLDGYGEEEITDIKQMERTYGEEPDKFFITYVLKQNS